MKLLVIPFILMFTILGNQISLRANEIFPAGEMANGNFVPGTVLIYDRGQWLTTEEENTVDPEKYTFVIIHGAHCSLKAESISRLAETLANEQPEANILAVDWSAWSSIGSTEIADWIVTIAVKLFRQNTNDLTSLKDVFAEIVKKAIPVEQARQIPEVADRLTWKLFGKIGKTRTFTTLDPTTKEEIYTPMTALGLSPRKTHLIGHSHGAHVAGLTGMNLKRKGRKQLDWISALDPSTGLVHDYPENPMGTGWDTSAARLVAVFRTTYFFSSARDATDDSLFFDWRDTEHPINHPKSGIKIIGWLNDILKAEFQYHSSVFEQFTKTIQNTDYLND